MALSSSVTEEPIMETQPSLAMTSPTLVEENEMGDAEVLQLLEEMCSKIPDKNASTDQAMTSPDHEDSLSKRIHQENVCSGEIQSSETNSEEQYFAIIKETQSFHCEIATDLDSDETRLDTTNHDTSPSYSKFSQRFLTHGLVGQSQQFAEDNYFKGCKWSPDGLCFLTNSQDNRVRIFNTPLQCLKKEFLHLKEPIPLKPCLNIQEPETVYDFCWWPLMNSRDPATCCFATTARDQPVHLWDAFDGHLRASYIPLNSVHEVFSANSICFSNNGQQLLCGFKRQLYLFYTDHPGTQCEKWSTYKKKQKKSQNNIISCLQFCSDDSMFACGCYDGTVGLYSTLNGHLLDFTVAHSAGVTHLKFSSDGNRIYTGARKDNFLKCWDVRNLSKPIYDVFRQASTNQRIYFDLINDYSTQQETFLLSGSVLGDVTVWSADYGLDVIGDSNESRTQLLNAFYTFTAHDDCTHGCSVHPFLPLIATSSGQRKFPEPCGSDDESNDFFKEIPDQENMVKLWYLMYDDEVPKLNAVKD